MSINGPHAAATIIDDDDFDNDCHHGRGCPAPPLRSVPSHLTPLFVVNVATAVDGGGTRAFGAWSYAGWRRKFRAIVLICQVLIQPGVDNGGKRSSVTLVGLRGRKRQAGE
jgi:hypothetical protein